MATIHSDTLVIKLHLKRFIYSQMAQHLIAAVMLFLAALEHLHGDESFELVLAVAEMVVVALLLGAVIFERIHLKQGHETPVNWVDIAAGLLAIFEAVNKRLEGHSWALTACYLFIGLVLIVKAVIVHRMWHTRRIELRRNGISLRFSRFRSFEATWEELERFDVDSIRIEAVRTDGRTCGLKFSSLLNGPEVFEKLMAALPDYLGAAESKE